MFDVYYCPDETVAKQFFHTKMYPKEVPQVYIIDPKAKIDVKGPN
mgnify:CR=1 FL=1